jgi:hypothetical protein
MTIYDAIIARAQKGEATLQDGQVILAGLQTERDRIQALIDDLPAYDARVIIRKDNDPKRLRFPGIDDLAKWIYPDGN